MTASPAPTVKRPSGVTLVSVFVVISGVVYLLSGIITLTAGSGSEVAGTNESRSLLVVGILTIVLGLVEFAVARGVLQGRSGARTIVTIVNALTLVSGVFGATQAGNQRGTSSGQVVVAIIVLILLYTPQANAFFRKGGRRV